MEKKLLLELLNINSESGNEREIGNFIIKRLGKTFIVEKQEVNTSTGNFNIFAYIGDPKIIFSAHVDTVKGQLEIKKDNEFIYGRGACDNKSQVAAMILAAESAVKQGIKDFGLLFTVQEETDFAGVKKAVDLLPLSTKLVVVGEPTSLEIVRGQKGLISCKVIAKGKSAHGSVPQGGVNAIEVLLNNINKLKNISFEKDYNLGESSLNIGTIFGGTSINVVPEYAEAAFEIRNTVNPKIILDKIKKELTEVEIEVINSYEPIFNDSIKISTLLDLKTKIVPYFTEAYFFNNKVKTIILGAGKEENAHSSNEKVEIGDFEKLISLYLKILKIDVSNL